MLQRSQRLPSSARLQQSKIFRTPYYMIKVAMNNLDHCRFGFTISKKVAKSAVDRNTSKRKLRAGIESLQTHIMPGNDFLFIITNNITHEPTDILHAELKNLLIEKGLISL